MDVNLAPDGVGAWLEAAGGEYRGPEGVWEWVEAAEGVKLLGVGVAGLSDLPFVYV